MKFRLKPFLESAAFVAALFLGLRLGGWLGAFLALYLSLYFSKSSPPQGEKTP